LEEFRRQEAHTHARRQRELGDEPMPPAEQRKRGADGPMQHWRKGLLGAVQYWAAGSRAYAVHLLVEVTRHFRLTELVRAQLDQEKERAAETNAYIVDRIKAALDVLKACQSEEQRREYLITLAAVAPPRAGQGDQTGKAYRVSERLCVRRGKRQCGRPYAFDKAQDLRSAFDERIAQLGAPLRVGESVLTRSGPAELTALINGEGNFDGGCAVTFRAGEYHAEHTYPACFGNGAGSARLRRMPLLLGPPPRELRSDRVTSSTRLAILKHVESTCPISPHQRDVMKKNLAPFVFAEKPSFILSGNLEFLYSGFREKHPDIAISFAQFKLELPWNIKHAYRETCLCRTCLNHDWHRDGIKVVAGLIAPLLTPPSADAESNEEEATDAAPVPLLKELHDFALLQSRREIGESIVCSETLGDKTEQACIDGKCDKCGFGRLWSRGLRPQVVKINERGEVELTEAASQFYQNEMMWDTTKPTGGNTPAGDDEDALRHRATGTIVEFLDAFEIVLRRWLPHRYHIVQAKRAARELDDSATPGQIITNSDWSENGEIAVKQQMQSEYWKLIYFSLLIKIAAFLVTSMWTCRVSPLSQKAEVTVQPVDAQRESIEHVAGSYFAIVEVGSELAGEDVIYPVVKRDGTSEQVPRGRLRHRVWHRVAFLGITDDKRHVGTTTQTFHKRELEFWRIWHEQNRDAAIKYALMDEIGAQTVSDSSSIERGPSWFTLRLHLTRAVPRSACFFFCATVRRAAARRAAARCAAARRAAARRATACQGTTPTRFTSCARLCREGVQRVLQAARQGALLGLDPPLRQRLPLQVVR
jgi:hypothetical protein